jgi:hypothetical protein
MTVVTIPDETRAALERTALFLKGQAEWLERTGSREALPQVLAYITTLERLARAPQADISGEECAHVQQSAFLLEGGRNSYRNADFKDRASKVEGDIAQLYDLVKEFNARSESE